MGHEKYWRHCALLIQIIILMTSCAGSGVRGGNAVASSNPVAVIGDSLSSAVAPYVRADNLALPGGTTTEIANHIKDRDLSHYKRIYVMAGINNITKLAKKADEILTDYNLLLDLIRSKTQAVIIVQSTLPRDLIEVNKEIQILNSGLQILSHKKGMVYIDLWPLFLDLDSGTLYSTKTVGGVHLTAKGYQEWADYLNAM
jgi:lysophospholipase L1-like esterase